MKIFTLSMNRYLKPAAVVFWIAVWQLLSFLVNNSLVIASPAETFTAYVRLLKEGVLIPSVLKSTLFILCGFALGSFTGAAAAVISSLKEKAEVFIGMLMRTMQTIPVAAFIILVLISAGNGFVSLIISFFVTAPVVYLSLLQGLKAADSDMEEMAEIFNISFGKRFKYIILPGLWPHLTAALENSLGMSFKSGVAAEVIGQPLGTIGNGMYRGKIYLATDEVLAWTAAVVITAAIIRWVMKYLLKKLEPGDRSL